MKSFFSRKIKIRVNEYDVRDLNTPENRRFKEYDVDDIITHPRYDPKRLSYDLAVLKVKTRRTGRGGVRGKIDLTGTNDINAACLPGCDDMFDYQFHNGTGVRYTFNLRFL